MRIVNIKTKQYVGSVISVIISMVFIINLMGSFVGQGTDIPEALSNQQIPETTADNSMILTIDSGGFTFKTIEIDGGTYTAMQIPDMGSSGEIGKPMVPFKSCHIAVPNHDLKVELINPEYTTYQLGDVYPAQNAPIASADDGENPPFVKDWETYSENAFYPENNVEISYTGSLRSLPFARLGIYPVQYNPVTQEARAMDSMDIRISWSEEPFLMNSGQRSSYYDAFYDNTFVNWNEFSKTYTNELSRSEPIPFGTTGCEYLIITDPSMVPAAEMLQDWKNERGYDTWVVDTGDTGTTAASIQSYIQNAYDTWTPAPSYILLLGDAEHIPTNYVNMHPYENTMIGTDLWYFTLDGPDYYADVFHGRMPVDNLAQAYDYVGKIVDYEKEPTTSSGYYTNLTVASYFQDDERNGYETRRFTRTNEEVRDYLMTQGCDVERIYHADSVVTPTNWNADTFGAPDPGAPIPAELLRSNGFAWDGDKQDIIDCLNAGSFILNHRDHGMRTGWADPEFLSSDISSLDNAGKLPIVFSVNCQTGWFDHETDGDDGIMGVTSTESFAEEFLRHDNGGCVCIFGATRVSYSGYNDYMVRGFYDSIWPEFDLTQGGTTPMYTMGEILNNGKIFMANTWADTSVQELTFEIFHLYGDPTMEIWTEEPEDMVVSHSSMETIGTTQITVNVNLDDALISIAQDGDLLGTAISSGGSGTVNVAPLTAGILNVTVTLHDYLPYMGLITVPATAIGTVDGPAGAGNNPDITITYDIGGTPTSMNLYYTTSTSAPYSWTFISNENPADGSYDFTLPGDGTYGFKASAIGGDSAENSPPLTSEVPETIFTLDQTAPNAPILNTVDNWGPTGTGGVTTEMRYLRSDSQTVNTVTGDIIGTTNSATEQTASVSGGRSSVYTGIRAYTVDSGGTRTEISGGLVATTARTVDGSGTITSTWTPPVTPMATTDSIVVELYADLFANPTTLRQTFTTEQLGATQLDANEWTVQYWTQRQRTSQGGSYAAWGDAGHENYIDGIQLTSWIPRDPLQDNTLNWTASISPDVDYYNVYRAIAIGGPYALIDTVPFGTNTYLDPMMGNADGILWWYYVRAVDLAGNEETNTNTVLEEASSPVWKSYDIPIPASAGPGDWVFVSFPYPMSGPIEYVLDDMNGGAGTTWNVAKWYNPQTPADPWETYRVGANTNDLTDIDNTMGVWLRLTSSDGVLTTSTSGGYSAGTVDINLHTGWNMVSYPSATIRLASTTLPAQANMVAYYDDAAPYDITDASPGTVTFSEGNAYWVHVTSDVTWSVAP